MIVLGRSYRDEQRRLAVDPTIVPLPRVVARLPDFQITPRYQDQPGPENGQTHRRQRHIEAAIEHDELVYRLVEKEAVTTAAGRIVEEDTPAVIMVSRSGFDLLHTGYELVEEDRLGELLTPYAEPREDRAGEPADDQAVAKVEEILETGLLPPSERLRARAEIVEFLEGRLEASVFITHVIERQCARECRREVRAQTQRREMRLTTNDS